jgi:hypothetical protein
MNVILEKKNKSTNKHHTSIHLLPPERLCRHLIQLTLVFSFIQQNFLSSAHHSRTEPYKINFDSDLYVIDNSWRKKKQGCNGFE